MSTEKEFFLCQRRNEKHQIDYYDIRGIRVVESLIWDSVMLKTGSASIQLEGLSAKIATSLHKDLVSRIQEAVATRLQENQHALEAVEDQTQILLQSDQYLSESDVRNWLRGFPLIGEELAHPFFDPSLLPERAQSSLATFLRVKRSGSRLIQERNDAFIEHAKTHHKILFERLEAFPLSDEQMNAAIINEDRNLLIAAAGSGKTSTIVAKAIYLCCAGLAKPEEVLILAYNKDAQVEVEKRLKDLVGIVDRYQSPIKAKTFHSFGYEILSATLSKRPSISKYSTSGKQEQFRLFAELIRVLYEKDPAFMTAWREFLLVDKSPTPDVFEIKTVKQYDAFMEELGAVRRSTPEGVSFMIPTIDGKEVRSFEEARIANWLALHGVQYEYERKYVNPNAPDQPISYHPDFYYTESGIYHEHFAINAQGETPPFIDANYITEMEWKRKTHDENGTTLIETHSAHFHDGSVFTHLEKQLKAHGVQFNPLSKKEADVLVGEAFDPEVDTALFITFLHHFKANNASIDLIKEKSAGLEDPVRVSLFIKLFEAIFREYTQRLKNHNEIDFEDQINQACKQLESNAFQHPFKYILVDEFQDTSQDRKRMIHALLDQNEEAKLFAVGDDWQSIYRFAGADIEIMTHFSDHFGTTSQNYLTQTFRSYRGIVDVASTFVQHNDAQIKKKVTAAKDVDKDQVIIYGYENDSDQANQLDKLLSRLNALPSESKLSVFLLARYAHLKPNILRRFPNLDINFSTIHASKGLEADYVILLNVESGSYGFPSSIEDDPLMHLVIPKPETFPHAEERRLMYVAITRAKKGMFIMSNKRKTSPFVKELANIDRVKPVALYVERLNPCPACDTGELIRRVGKFGAFHGCSNYPECEHSVPIKCPKCGTGKLIRRESKFGPFLSCSTFPKCKYSEKINR